MKTKTIKVFLASSEELGQERLEVGDLFDNLNSIFKHRGVVLEISKWEYLDESMGILSKQEEYNREIKTCDMCIVLYWTRMGKFTNEELETAYDELKAGRKPYKLYIYFKEVGELSPEIEEFKKEFYHKYGHFYGKFENVDTLKLRFLLQLERYVNSGAIKVENSQVMVEDLPVVHLDNVAFAAQNGHYRKLKESLTKLEEEIKTFEAIIATQENEMLARMLNEKRSERNKLQEELSSHEQSLFDTAMRVAKLAGEKISERTRRAIALFEEGKVTEANTLLDDAEHDADISLAKYKQTKELLATEREAVIYSIEELTLKASVMLADEKYSVHERVERTIAIYEKAVSLARECDYDKEKLAELLEKQSSFLAEHARYDDAKRVNKEWLEVCEQYLSSERHFIATAYHNIGFVHRCLGNYDKSLEYFNKSLEIRLSYYGSSHSAVATCYNNIGAVHRCLGNYDKSLEYFNKSLEIRLSYYGSSHPNIATCYNNIGFVYDCLGEYDKALEYYNKSLEIDLSCYGSSHPDVAMSYNNIGSVHGHLGKYNKALEYYNKSLEICLSCYGSSHPDVATCYNNIGFVYDCLGEYDKSLVYYNKSLEIDLSCYGSSHPDVATCYNNIGSVHDSLGEYDKALEYYNKSLEIDLSYYGSSHPAVATCYNNIGSVHDSLGEYDKALEYYNKSLEIRLSYYGSSHPAVATVYCNIGGAYNRLGDNDKALEYIRRGAALGSEECMNFLRDNGIEE